MTAATPIRGLYSGTDARPFVKWAGGKRQLLHVIEQFVPRQFGRYFEPFVGGGALFFHLHERVARARLADVNLRLVRAYWGVRDAPERVLELLGSYPADKDFFLGMRKKPIDRCSDAECAAWLIYLNKTGYNGLYRVNSKNEFNVPYGDNAGPLVNPDSLRSCARALKKADIFCEPFDAVAAEAQAGDFVYFDPPYVPLSKTANFTTYSAGGFDLDAQRRLRDLALALKERGVHVLLSNSNAPEVHALYAGKRFKRVEVGARRYVNRDASGRGEVTELLIR